MTISGTTPLLGEEQATTFRKERLVNQPFFDLGQLLIKCSAHLRSTLAKCGTQNHGILVLELSAIATTSTTLSCNFLPRFVFDSKNVINPSVRRLDQPPTPVVFVAHKGSPGWP